MRVMVLIILLGWQPLSAQRPYIPLQTVDSVQYRHYKSLLQMAWYNDSIRPNSDDKHMMWICYYHLDAPMDTFLHSMWRAVHADPVFECWMQVERPETWTVRNKRLEPRRDFVMRRYCDSLWRTYDSAVVRALDTMQRWDEKYRKSADDAPWIAGNDKKWKEQHALDSLNQHRLSAILDRIGYPGRNLVGYDMRDAAFMIIQHAELAYQERYYSMVERAAAQGQMTRSLLPMIIDRINMRKGIPQIYGTQAVWNEKRKVMELYKVKSLKDINKLRAAYDMPKLSEYLRQEHIELAQ